MFLLKQATHRMLMQYDADIGHRFVPNLRARVPNQVGGYFVVTNSMGFRSDFEFESKKKERPRILMFGDSYTAGDNVSNPDRYSDQLAGLLDAEVYNFGISGSGTDQHLLACRKFARDIEADLVVVCVQIDSFHRIQTPGRPSIDRVTGDRIIVPKPYFELVDDQLQLNHVPVPLDRPRLDEDVTAAAGKRDDKLLQKVHDLYRSVPGLSRIRESSIFEEFGSRLITEARRIRGHHAYPDIESDQSPGWKLMEAILREFVAEVAPTPVAVVPIPTRDFYQVGIKPVYQSLFGKLDDPSAGIHVGDVSTTLCTLPYQQRMKLSYEVGGHFTPHANGIVAEKMAEFISDRKLIGRSSPSPLARQSSVCEPKSTAPKDDYVLGISAFYHNSAAALIRNGEIVAAAEEERFSRVKNDRRFPHQAVNFCLEQAGIDPSDLKAVAFYDDSALTFERIMHGLMAVDREDAEKMWDIIIPDWVQSKLHVADLVRDRLCYDGLVLHGVHHRSHAASCFFPSPLESAAVLTVDGVGEWATAAIGHGQGSRLQMLQEMRFPNSLGLLYSAFTHYTGFKVNSGEYKMMGLAPYGRPIYTQAILDNIVDLKPDGSIDLNMDYFAFLSDTRTTSDRFDELFGGPRRTPDQPITRREMDLARSIQEVTEEAICRMARHALQLTGEKNLCLAGGVALNCVANGKLIEKNVAKRLWIQPAAGDSGCALGVALDVWHTYFDQPRRVESDAEGKSAKSPQGGSYLGPEFGDDEIKAYLDTNGYPYTHVSGDSRNELLAKTLAEGKVVGHFSGRLEFGPRSLGARSILGDARNTDMQVTLNLRIKYRESFRPFAPAVRQERVSDYFELDCESPYMLIVAPVREDRRMPFDLSDLDENEDMLPIVRRPRSDLPAITHVDYSARVQSVRRDYHEAFYDLIEKFEEQTGCGVLVNTSFNVRGEPIVCTPHDAYRCFMRTEMDVLALGDFVLEKADQPAWPEGSGEGLEDEDSRPVVLRPESSKLRSQLSKVFVRDFWPTAESLRERNMVDVPIQRGQEFSRRERPERLSTWVGVNERTDWHYLFERRQLDTLRHDVDSIADQIIGRWENAASAEALREVVTAMLVAGRSSPTDVLDNDEVSESVYVMF